MTEAIIVALIANLALIIKSMIDQRAIAKDAKIARDQTANSHETNLRDDLDGVAGRLSDISKDLQKLQTGLESQGASIDRIKEKLELQHEDDEFLKERLERAREYHDNALLMAVQDRHTELALLRRDIPEIIDAKLAEHVHDCPLRSGKDRPPLQ